MTVLNPSMIHQFNRVLEVKKTCLRYKTSARKPRGLAPWMNRTFIVF